MGKWYDAVKFLPPPFDNFWEPLPMMAAEPTKFEDLWLGELFTVAHLGMPVIVDPRVLILPEKKSMDEHEWLTSSNPAAMLAHIHVGARNDRRREAFITACRERWLTYEWRRGLSMEGGEDGFRGWISEGWMGRSTAEAPMAERCDLIRELFGNPFRSTSLCRQHPDPYHLSCTGSKCPEHQEILRSLLSWGDGLIPKLARSIRGEKCKHCGGRGEAVSIGDECFPQWDTCNQCHGTGKTPSRFEDMPILADALEEAGCQNEDMLNHCRGLARCPDCLGDGGKYHDASYVKCNGTGWVRNDFGHVAGCVVLSLLLGGD